MIGTIVIAIVVKPPNSKGFAWPHAMPIVGGVVLISCVCGGGILIRRKRRAFISKMRKEREEMKRKIRDGIVEEMLEQQRQSVVPVNGQTTVRIGADESDDELEEEEEEEELRRPAPPPMRKRAEDATVDSVDGVEEIELQAVADEPAETAQQAKRKSLRQSAMNILGEYFHHHNDSDASA